MRTFDSGATRDTDEGKIDFEGFLSPFVLERFGQYMLKHQVQADGKIRASDNWQKGIPMDQYLKSFLRHTMEFWKASRGAAMPTADYMEEVACAILFNIMGWLHESLKLDVTLEEAAVAFEKEYNTVSDEVTGGGVDAKLAEANAKLEFAIQNLGLLSTEDLKAAHTLVITAPPTEQIFRLHTAIDDLLNERESAGVAVPSAVMPFAFNLAEEIAALPTRTDDQLSLEHTLVLLAVDNPPEGSSVADMLAYHDAIDAEGRRRQRVGGVTQ